MEFTVTTLYHQKALTAMAKTLRKTTRKRKSRLTHIFGWVIIAVSMLLSLPVAEENYVITANKVFTWLAAAMVFVVIIWEDPLNGYIARKKMLPGTEKAIAYFTEDGFESTTDIGKTSWLYDRITVLAETKDYFVFVFSANHAQVYDKNVITGGTADEFRTFLTERTGKDVLHVK